ncbi:MAG: hypothetical protein RL173_2815 [Fibrobacterota bacterium]|jgi:hypothetical protein
MRFDRNRLHKASVRIAVATFALAPIVGAILLCTRTEGKPLGTVAIEACLLLGLAIPFHFAFARLPRSCGGWLVASVFFASVSVPWYFLCLYVFQNHPGGMPTWLRFELIPLCLFPAASLECANSCHLRARDFESGSFRHRYLEWISKF